MATNWDSGKRETTTTTSFKTALSSWSRQQKLALIACLAMLGFFLAISACSKQSSKPDLVSISSTSAASALPPADTTMAQASPLDHQDAAKTTTKKKVQKNRPANVTYSDPEFGVSFSYPRKFALASSGKAESQSAETSGLPMNFVQPGGLTVATVNLPGNLYPGTDFASGFFTVNVNRSISQEECPHFAFVDTSDADGEPIDAQKVKVGSPATSKEMEMTSEFEGSATRQLETQYYHDYENGACYEYVLGLGTAGYGTKQDVEPVNRDAVFARLEKILATVKVQSVAHEQDASEKIADGKEAVKAIPAGSPAN